MKKTLLAVAATAVVGIPSLAQAQAAAPAAAPAPDWTITGNATLVTDYRFRGISQTNKKPAFQGGFDIGHKSGFYVGNWNSNIDSTQYGGGNLEMDFYGGFKATTGDFSWDVGALYYYYPGSGQNPPGSPKIDNTELYVSGGWGPFSLKYSYAVSDFFSVPDSKGAYYLDASLSYPLGPVTMVGHVGYQGNLKNGARIPEIGSTGAPRDSITDWKLGVTYDASGWLLGASYIGTNRDYTAGTAAASNRNISNDTLVLSVGKTF